MRVIAVSWTRVLCGIYVQAYLLLQLGGKEQPTKDDITKLLSSAGIEVDGAKVDKFLSEVKSKPIDQMIKEGSTKMAGMLHDEVYVS